MSVRIVCRACGKRLKLPEEIVEPLKPFLYIPVGCRADRLGPGELTVTLPDNRAATLRVAARYACPLARDAIAFGPRR